MSEYIPFGWKSSAYIYHTTSLVASHRLRSWNMRSSLYIEKKGTFLRLVKETLPRDTLGLLTLQRLGGKCMSLRLAVPGAGLYVNKSNIAVSSATRSSLPVKMSPALKNEIEHWLFLKSWDGFLPW